MMRSVSRIGLALAAALLVGVGAAQAARHVRPRYEKVGSVHWVHAGTVDYSFDSAWRREALAPDHADRLPAMRRILLTRLGVERLDQIPREGESAIRAIRALGYF